MTALNAVRKIVTAPRNLAIATVGLVAANSSFAADGDIASAAGTAINSGQAQGLSVGALVVACVAALCVVGIVIAMVRKI